MEDDYVITDLENVDPSPIAPRVCACGCGNIFQPRRENHININKKHTDKGYHKNVRKPKQRNQNIVEKIHRLNDRLCAKYFSARKNHESIYNWESLLADGFNENYIHGEITDKGFRYVLTYSYMYRLFKEDGIQKVQIKKQ